MKIWDYPQQSEQWFRARAGRVTASQFSRLLTPMGKDSSQWYDYAIELCAECVRWDEVKWEGNFHTDRGNEQEPEARELFEKTMNLECHQVGFITRDDEIIGCSPDSLIKDKKGEWMAGLEIKCPMAKNHAKALVANAMPSDYRCQVHGNMAVTGLRHWYFMSYCRGIPPLIVLEEWGTYTDHLSRTLDRFLKFYHGFSKDVMPILLGKANANDL